MTADAFAVDVPFIGRVDELALVRRVLDDALAGHPRLLLLSGDAGVGKSRLVAEATTAASASGFTVLIGTCHADVAIPYLPLAAAFRRIDHPGARAITPTAGRPAKGVADQDAADLRLERCLDATAALVDTTASGPTMLVIEDLHWADEATAELLRHVLLSGLHEAAMTQLPLVALLSARERWPDGVPRALARLPREANAVELHLNQFGVVEAHAMVTALTGARPRTEVTAAILDATAGNPLLMRGVITRAVTSGQLEVVDDEVRLVGDRPLSAPTDLDDELRIGLDEVGPEARALLTSAAVLGDGAEVAALRAAWDGDSAGPLAEATRAGLLHVGTTRYRFAHPQLRQVLYHDLDHAARAAAHLRIATALEGLDGVPGRDRALAIAHHLRRGGADPNDQRVASWALRAGDQAWAAGAWSEATTAYAVALRGAAPTTLAEEDLTEVLLRAGVAAYYANDDSCTMWLGKAADLAQRRGDVTRGAEALLLKARFRLIGTAATVGAPAPVAELESLLDSLDDQPSLRARTHATLSDLHFVGLEHEQAAAHAREAEAALDHDLDDPTAAARVSFVLGLQELTALDLPAAHRHFARVVESGDDHSQLAALTRIGLIELVEGNVDKASATLAHARAGERALSSHAGQQLPSAGMAGIWILQGRFADAERLAAEVVALYEIQPYAFTPGMVLPLLAAARVERGDVSGAREAIEQWRSFGGRGTWRYDALIRALAGDREAVAAELAVRPWPEIGDINLFTIDIPCLHVALGVVLGDLDLVRTGVRRLEQAHERGLAITLGWPWLVSRLIGDGHAALGDLAAAARWYRTAGTEADGALVVERAQITLGRARLALAQGHVEEAAALAATSAAELDAVDAMLLARVARSTVDRSGGVTVTPPRDRIILFTDMVGSTDLNVRAGDDEYVALLEEHDRILRARFRRHDGVFHSHTGDGMSAWFTSASAALDCAFGMHADLERASMMHPELPISVRIGISSGRPVDTGEGLFGLAVVESARICALAGAGQVFVTEAVREQADGACTFRALGTQLLKGFPEPQPVHEALPLVAG